jgi:hypothetical protein
MAQTEDNSASFSIFAAFRIPETGPLDAPYALNLTIGETGASLHQ